MNIKLPIIAVLCLSFGFLASAEDCKFGLILPLSGDYVSVGDFCRTGAEVARQAKPDRNYQVNYITGDSRGLAKDAVNEFKKIAEIDQVQAAMVVRAPCGMAVNPLSSEKKLPLLGVVGHNDFISQNPYAFRLWPSVKLESQTLAEQAMKAGSKKIIIISSADDWLLSFGAAFERNYKNLGGEIVYADTILPDLHDFRSLILRLRNLEADGIFINVSMGQLGTFIKQIKESDFKHKLYSIFWVNTPDVIKTAGYANLAGLTFVEPDSIQSNFVKKFKELAPHLQTNSIAYTCYAAVAMLEEACEIRQKTQQDFQSIFLGMSQINTLDGGIKLTEREAEFKIAIKVFEGYSAKQIN